MKKQYLIALLTLGLVSCGGVTPSGSDVANNSTSSPSVSETKPDSGSTSTAPSTGTSTSTPTPTTPVPPSNSTSPSTSIAPSVDDTPVTPTLPGQDEVKDEHYAYQPKLGEKLPEVHIKTDDGKNDFITVPDRNYKLANGIEYVTGSISVKNCEESYLMTDVATSVKARGNYTLDYPQKAIRIKFDKKQSFLGLNEDAKNKSWVLLADYKDLANSRNALSYYLGKTMLEADGYYCSDFRHVNVYINDQYWGVYLAAEQQQTGSSRVNIAEPDKNYTGTDIGYMFELDYYYDQEDPNKGGDPTFTINYDGNSLKNYDNDTVNGFIKGYTLKSDIYSQDQVNFIKNYTQNVYKIMYQAAYKNKFYKFNDTYTGLVEGEFKDAQECISEVVDLQSLVDMYLLQDISCDPDVGYSSFYLDVDMSAKGDKKLRFEAPWDYDSAYGITNRMSDPKSGVFASNHKGQNQQPYYPNAWFTVLIHQPWFMHMIKTKWAEMVAFDVFQKSLDLVYDISTKYESDFNALKNKWTTKFNYMSERTTKANSRTSQKESAQDLLDWTTDRYKYLDSVYGKSTLQLSPKTIVANLGDGGNGGGNNPWGPGGGGWMGETSTPTNIAYNENDNHIENGVNYRYEAESATPSETGVTLKPTSGNNSSKGGYTGDFRVGGTLTFAVNSASESDAYFYLGLANREYASISSWFTVSVNGTQINPTQDKYVPGPSTNDGWHEWLKMPVGTGHLKAGANVVVVTANQDNATNFDYLEIYSPVVLN